MPWRKFLCKIGWHDDDEELLDESGGGAFAYRYTCKHCGYQHVYLTRY